MPFINDMLGEMQRKGTTPMAVPPDSKEAPPFKHSRFLFEPDRVMSQLRHRILGQPAALDALDAALRVIKADIRDPRRPLYIALLIGPTGVGKTEIVRVLAEAIHGKPDAFCRIDMNTLAQDHYAAAISGAPPGYVGSKEGTTLLDVEAIQGSFGRPGIVLFDEIEKASKDVIRTLLNVLDNGRLTLTSGARTIDFRNSLIFMSSNLGADALWRYEDRRQRSWRRLLPQSLKSQQQRVSRIVEQALFTAFDPEFINRIDQRIQFNWIDRNQLAALIDLELEKLNGRLRRQGVLVQLDPCARRYLCEVGYDRRFGARAMGRAFRLRVEVAVAEALTQLTLPHSTFITALLSGEIEGGRLRFRVRQEEPYRPAACPADGKLPSGSPHCSGDPP